MEIPNRIIRGGAHLEPLRTATFRWWTPPSSPFGPGSYCSPSVDCFNMLWYLEKRQGAQGLDYVGLCREPSPAGLRGPFHFTITYKTVDGVGGDVVRDQTFRESDGGQDPNTAELYRIPGDNARCLSFTCTLGLRIRDSPRAQVQQTTPPALHSLPSGASRCKARRHGHVNPAFKALSAHFKELLLSGDHHDFLIRVQDKEFRTHKCVLSLSPVFAAMFRHETAESVEDSATIEDCDPDSFGEFLQFIYSGSVDIASVSRALGLYYAADKYDLPSLKEMCVEFLKDSITATTLTDIISLAAQHNEEDLLQRTFVYFAENLEEVLRTAEWQRFHAANFHQASEMYLKAVKRLKTSLRGNE